MSAPAVGTPPSVNVGDLLANKTAIITGGAQGIGWAIGELFAANGARVVLLDVAFPMEANPGDDTDLLLRRYCDVTDATSVHDAVEWCVASLGQIDVLVNNAGVTRDGLMKNLGEADFDIVVDVSLKGAWLMSQAVAPHMRQAGGGAIVNISSISGKIGNRGQTNYSAAKAGLIGLTKSMAKELAFAKIRVNALQPGLIRTAMTAAMQADDFAERERSIPLGRAGEPVEVAQAALFLASELASYVTAAVLEVSGGRG
jgi:3-oxoacyl-[acyl-carrier protein] reductase